MSKLKLSVEELRVESFHTAESPHARGTVRGAEDGDESHETCRITCVPSCYFPCGETAGCETNESACVLDSCGATCVLTCGVSCGGTCAESCGCDP